MNKEQFRKQLAILESRSYILCDLLKALIDDQFESTAEGARKDYELFHGKDEAQCALSWMNEHYASISASVYAASLIADLITATLEPLWNEANELIKDDGDKADHQDAGTAVAV